MDNINTNPTHTESTPPKWFKVIPSGITLLALCLGLWSIKFTINGQIENAVLCIFFSACLDALDGKLARLLKSDSEFGATLDSLADFANFGIAPAILVYFTYLKDWYKFGWLFALFFVICMSLRLARFASSTPKYKNCFMGIPAPGGALLALTTSIMHIIDFPVPEYIHAFTLLLASIGLISTIPTFAFFKIRVPREYLTAFFIILAMVASLIIMYTWYALLAINLGYVFSMLYTIPNRKKLLDI